ncbi:MAG: hypothetical protein ACO21P_00400 [Candidatus Nanopelagicales bacterium]
MPIVWRSDTCVEMGWPPRQARVDGVDHPHVAWLVSLKGERTLEKALDAGRATGLQSRLMKRLVRVGEHCGLVDDSSGLPTSLRQATLTRRDRLAADFAAARHLHGPDGRHIIDRRQAAQVAVQGDSQLAEVVALILTSAGVGRVLRAHPTRSTSRRLRRTATQHTCVVLCDAAPPDAASDTDARTLDIPHLVVAAAGARAVIGPFVIPGHSSCLRCRALHLADADATWPRAAVQWSARKPAVTSTVLAHVAGAWAALQVLALLDAASGPPSLPTINGALTITLPDGQPTHEPRPAHALCGCRWPRTGTGVSA